MENHTTLGDRELMEAILVAEVQADAQAKFAKAGKEELMHRQRQAVAGAYAAKGSQFGVIHLELQGFEIDITTSARVDWDQDRLAYIEREIRDEWLADPAEYIDRKLNVKESKYKAWPSDLRTRFEPARTVRASAPSLSITPRDKE